MGNHAEDALAQFLLEAVHDRQHDDQRRHPEGEAGHGDQRDEGNEAVGYAFARLGARVSQTDEEFVVHALFGLFGSGI